MSSNGGMRVNIACFPHGHLWLNVSWVTIFFLIFLRFLYTKTRIKRIAYIYIRPKRVILLITCWCNLFILFTEDPSPLEKVEIRRRVAPHPPLTRRVTFDGTFPRPPGSRSSMEAVTSLGDSRKPLPTPLPETADEQAFFYRYIYIWPPGVPPYFTGFYLSL